ncbi:MAG: ABC transporter substrate-binding protein [Anaerolineales bacterium]
MNSQRYSKPQLFISQPLFAILLVVFVSSCALPGGAVQELQAIDVQLNWYHFAPFAGFYAADHEGLYQDQGLRVTFHEAGPQDDYITPVVEGRADFGVALADALMEAQAEGAPLVAVAAILQHSPVVLVSKPQVQIRTLSDLAGKTIRITNQTEPIVEALLHQYGVPMEAVEFVNLPSSLDEFESGSAEVWTVYSNSFPVQLAQEGYELNSLFPDDFQVHFYGDVLFTHERTVEAQPELVASFVQATFAGYRIVIEDEENVGLLVTEYAPEANSALELEKWRGTMPLMLPGRKAMGWIEPDRWEQMRQVLARHGDWDGAQIPAGGFTNQFVENGQIPESAIR